MIKKLRNQLANSGNSDKHTRYMMLEGQPLLWQHVETVREADQSGPLRTTPLTLEHTNLDSVTKMKNKLAFDVFDPSVEIHMLRHNAVNTIATRQYLEKCRILMEVFTSTEPLKYPHDGRIRQIKKVKEWFVDWHENVRISYLDKTERHQRFVAWQTYEDLRLAVNGLSALIDHITELKFIAQYGSGFFVIPRRLSQDILESYFSIQRASGGGNTNMTAYSYGHNTQHLILGHVARKNKRSVDDEEDRPLHKRARSTPTQTILWPHSL